MAKADGAMNNECDEGCPGVRVLRVAPQYNGRTMILRVP